MRAGQLPLAARAAALLRALTIALAAAAPTLAAADAVIYPSVVPGRALTFPADYGSHPAYRTEWWYVTGWLYTATGAPLGFQITFFRTRPGVAEGNPSALAARQLLIAHAAISDPGRGRPWHDERIRRAGLGLAEARVGDTDVRVGDWSLRRDGNAYQARVPAADFSLDLEFTAGAPPMLNGDSGYSRKGPEAGAASEYYSVPHLAVSGRITRGGGGERVHGEAWLDHEWSSEYLDPQAVGWDWIGIDLDDGGAIMAFRIRGANDTVRWSGGTVREADGRVRALAPGEVRFAPLRTWRSPHTGVLYPVAMRVTAGAHDLELAPLLDDQENDTRLSTGAIYWEGAVRARERGAIVGRGYLELTGYGARLRLR